MGKHNAFPAFTVNLAVATTDAQALDSMDGIVVKGAGGAGGDIIETGTFCYIKTGPSAGFLYKYDTTSLAVADGSTVVRPRQLTAAVPGRWLLVLDSSSGGFPASAHNAYSAAAPNVAAIGVIDTFVPIPAAPTAFVLNPASQNFAQDPGAGDAAVKYTGGVPARCIIDAAVSLSLAAAGTESLGLAIFVNGALRANTEFTAQAPFSAALATQTLVSGDELVVAPADIIEARLRNRESTIDINVFAAMVRVSAA